VFARLVFSWTNVTGGSVAITTNVLFRSSIEAGHFPS